jgi:hypothetical protein
MLHSIPLSAFNGQGLRACTISALAAENMNHLDICYDSLAGGSAHRKASTFTGQYKHRGNATYIHTPKEIGNGDPSVRALEDGMRLRKGTILFSKQLIIFYKYID